VRFSPEPALSGKALVGLVGSLPGASLSPQGVLRIPSQGEEKPLEGLDSLMTTLEHAGGPGL
jgi:hypothetical protein